MGAGVSVEVLQTAITADPPVSVDWSVLGHPSLHALLSSDYVFKHPTTKLICQSLMQHPAALWSLCDAIPQAGRWQLTANLVNALRIFVAFVFASHQSYGFLYHAEDEKQRSAVAKDDFAFSKQVRCVFRWQNHTKSLLISVPQTSSFDPSAETKKLIAHVLANFESLREHVKSTNKYLVFSTDSNDLVDMREIAAYYSKNKPEDRIVNPFAAEHIEDTAKPLSLHILTTECVLNGKMASFLSRIVEFYVELSRTQDDANLAVRHACVSLLVTVLSSQMYYLRPSGGDTTYADFVHSPALDILLHMNKPGLLTSILSDFATAQLWQAPQASGFFAVLGGILFGTGEITPAERLLPEVRHNSLTLALICLAAVTHFPNQLLTADLQSVAGELIKTLQKPSLEARGLLLLYILLKENRSFRNCFVASPGRDDWLLELCRQLYTSKPEKHTVQHFTIVLSILVLLSEDEELVHSLSVDTRFSGVPWISGYQTSGISLGSVLFLCALHFLKENALLRQAYLQVLVSGLLFNLSKTVTLHEYPAQVFLSTIKSVFLICAKHGDDPKGYEARQLLHVLLDLLVVQLRRTMQRNTWLVYMTLHEAEAVAEMVKMGICPRTATVVHGLIEKLLPKIETENVFSSVSSQVATAKLEDCPLEVFEGVEGFRMQEDPQRWEAWAVPFVWMEAAKLGLSALKFEAELAYSK